MKYKLDENYDSLARIGKWDNETQNVIKKRIGDELGGEMIFSFLDEKEGAILKILTDILVPQYGKNYVKIAEAIDKTLSYKKEGVRYGENPWRGYFYKKGLSEISEKTRNDFGKTEECVSAIFESEEDGFLKKFLNQVLRDSAAVYYSHPAAWNEIGFPGPAYPEGYPFLDCGEKESWEPDFK